MNVEVLAVRHPDANTDVLVWLDGVPADQAQQHTVHVHDVDPGRGYTTSDWESEIAAVRRTGQFSTGFRDAIVTAMEGYRGHRYLDLSPAD